MKLYCFFRLNGEACTKEADPLRPETWPYPREEIEKVHLDCTDLFLSFSHPIPREKEKFRELLDCISIRYKEKLSFDFALSVMGMGKTRFCKYFRNQTGMSLVAYINKIRIEHAARFLIETDRTTEAIGFDCGFDSCSNFFRCFNKYFGTSPAQFRLKKK